MYKLSYMICFYLLRKDAWDDTGSRSSHVAYIFIAARMS